MSDLTRANWKRHPLRWATQLGIVSLLFLLVVACAPAGGTPAPAGEAAAAEAPASPVPTTRILCLRLLAGETSFMPNLWWDHLLSKGPEGMFASSFMVRSLLV